MITLMLAALAAAPATLCAPPRDVRWEAEQVFLDGKDFRRLSSRELRAVIVGKTVKNPPRQHTPGQPWSTPWMMDFHEHGVATDYDDRGDYEVSYEISSDAIQVNYKGFPPERLAFFRSADGDFAMGSYPEAGCMSVRKMMVKAAT